MKKGTLKYIVGGSMVAFGILLIFIAVCIGGWGVLIDFRGISIDWDGVHYFGDSSNGIYESGGDSKLDKDSINKLNINVDYGRLIIKTGDADEIRIDTKNVISRRFSCTQSGDTLVVKYGGGFSFFTWKSDSEITITLPKDMTFAKTYIRNGAGVTDVKDLNSKEISINNGAGELIFTDIQAEDMMYIDNGAGAITLNNINCGKLDFDGGVGEIKALDVVCTGLDLESGVGTFKFSGEINGNADIDNGVGEVKMTVYGNVSDYRFDVDQGIGEVRVNGQVPIQGTEGKYRFCISTGVGEVSVNFKDKEN